MALCIKVAKSTGPCTLCDGPAEPTGGLAIVVEGTDQQVCRQCAETVAPQLVAVLPATDSLGASSPKAKRKNLGASSPKVAAPSSNGQHLSDSQRAMIAAKLSLGRK
jgi:hypothetical protein